MKVIFCVGMSGSGKTTWTSRYIKAHPNTIRVNRDEIRRSLVGNMDGYYQRPDFDKIEGVVTEVENSIFQTAARRGFDVISDNNNLKMSYISNKVSMMRGYCGDMGEPFNFKIKIFNLDVRSCKKRVQLRDGISNEEQVSYIDKQREDFYTIDREINIRWKAKIME